MRSWKPRLQVIFNRIWTASTGQEMVVCFYTAKTLCWFQPRSFNQYILCSTIKQSVKYEDSQHFVSRNLWTAGTAIHQIAIITYFTNFYDTFYATPWVPLWTKELIATQLGYKVPSVAYTEAIHFQYYIFCTETESFYYTKVYGRNSVVKRGVTVWRETNILRNLKRKCGGHGIFYPHCLRKWGDASPVSPT